MASFDKKLVSVVLNAIRSRRKVPSDRQGVQQPTTAKLAPAKVREARFSDFEAVAALKQRWELAADSVENWERLWRHNPALAHTGVERPIGWVLEADGNVVGYIGNIAQTYRYGDKTLTSVTSHGLVVDPPYRGIGVSLLAAYFRQKSVDLFISTGAIEPVGKIGRRIFKCEEPPQIEYETVLFWVLRPYSFAGAVMKKLKLGPVLSPAGSMLGSLVLGADNILHRRRPRKRSDGLAVTEIGVNEIGDDFQDLWFAKVNERPQLLAERSTETLRWHFEVPGDIGTVRVLCCSKGGRLLGYTVVRNEAPDEASLRKSVIADLLVRNDEPAVIEALLAAAHHHAKQSGSDILEVMGFPHSVRAVMAQAHPYVRKYPTRVFGYKAVDAELHKTLCDGTTWYASPYDGDLTLIRPSFSTSARAGEGLASHLEDREPSLR